MSKKFLPWSDFALPEQAVDLIKESVRNGVEFDAFGGRQNFTAIALTNAYLLDDVDAAGYGVAADGLNLGTGAKYKFKARIIDEDSPHLFLPDPCSLAANDNQVETAAAIQRHTDFIQVDANNGSKVSMGDIVQVSLKKNVFSYDLQVGLFNKVLAHNANAASLLNDIDCVTLVSQFSDLPEGPEVGVSLAGLAGVSYNPGVEGTKNQIDWLKRFMRNLANEKYPVGHPQAGKPYITKIHVTDAYRDYFAMAKIFHRYLIDPVTKLGEEYLRGMYGGKSPTPFANYGYLNQIFAVKNEVVQGRTKDATEAGLKIWIQIIAAAFNAEPQALASRHQIGCAIDFRTRDPLYTDEQLQALARAVQATRGTKSWVFEPFPVKGKAPPWIDWHNKTTVKRNPPGRGPVDHEHMHISIEQRYPTT